MPAVGLLEILLGVGLTFGALTLMFISFAFERSPLKKVPQETTEKQSRAWFRRVSHNRIDPTDCGFPTFAELLKRAPLDDLGEATSRSTVS